MRYLLRGLGLVLIVIIAGMVWQYQLYASIRTDRLQDRQAPFYSSDNFHAILYLAGTPGDDIIAALKDVKANLNPEAHGGKWIYAGKVVIPARQSAQLEHTDWSAILLLQYPNRAAYEAHAASASYQSALAPFDRSYAHGMRRSAVTNVMLHQGFLFLKAWQYLTFQKSPYPFEKADTELMTAEERMDREQMHDALRANSDYGRDAIMVFNLMKDGSEEQSQANDSYALKMMAAMARLNYGVMHLGDAETVEGSADFDSVGLVYYPGTNYFIELTDSTYFNNIIGDKQLSDTLAVITVPVLDHL